MNVKKKKVIFIGGTAYSGSTFFDLILSNDPAGFSCGEVKALFNSSQLYHLNPLCGCGSKSCNLWQQVLKGGRKNLYSTIFNLSPDVEFIVDSSKEPYWIRSQTKNLIAKGIECKHILIWKTPLEFAHSYKKRGKVDWHKAWISYHRMYLTAIKDWRSVKYSELANNPNTLKMLCNCLKIPYFSTKYNYWDKSHHILFGNESAKMHLQTKSSLEGKVSEGKNNHNTTPKGAYSESLHRTIYYSKVNDQDLKKNVQQLISCNVKLQKMLALLNERDITNEFKDVYSDYNLNFSWLHYNLRTVKRLIGNRLKKYKNLSILKLNRPDKNQ
jgi:hypothetical protein